MGQFYDENKIKEMESAAQAPGTPPPSAQPQVPATSKTSSGHFYDEEKIRAMQGATGSSSAGISQPLVKYAMIALVVIIAIGVLWWKAKHNPDTMILDLNKASVTELEYIDGIGPARAKEIIAHRPYTSVDDLKKVPGIGAKTIEKIKPRVKVE